MAAVVFLGDCTTTTALAIAATWPRDRVPACAVVECDPSGGSLAAWLDLAPTPSLSNAVTAVRHDVSNHGAPGATSGRGAADVVAPMLRRSRAGVRVLVAPALQREARSAVDEADRALLALLGRRAELALVDAGRQDVGRPHPAVGHASLVVLVHRQQAASPRATAVRLERTAESAAELRDRGAVTALMVIGEEPFDASEIHDFVGTDHGALVLPDDPLASSVLAGRGGVSTKRMARLPLMRAAARVSDELLRWLGDEPTDDASSHVGPGSRDRSRRVPSTSTSEASP